MPWNSGVFQADFSQLLPDPNADIPILPKWGMVALLLLVLGVVALGIRRHRLA